MGGARHARRPEIAEMPALRGFFITFEGPEGSGKTTQAQRLAARLTRAGYEVIVTREPGGTPTGEVIRSILLHKAAGEPLFPETEALLFAASRAQLVRAVIQPALARGACVICDRFLDSTMAYQGYGRRLDLARIDLLNEFAVDGVIPDLTLLLDLDIRTGFARLAFRNRRSNSAADSMEREDLEFHERTRQGYLELARKWPWRIHILNAERNPDEVEAEIWRITETVLRQSKAGPRQECESESRPCD